MTGGEIVQSVLYLFATNHILFFKQIGKIFIIVQFKKNTQLNSTSTNNKLLMGKF